MSIEIEERAIHLEFKIETIYTLYIKDKSQQTVKKKWPPTFFLNSRWLLNWKATFQQGIYDICLAYFVALLTILNYFPKKATMLSNNILLFSIKTSGRYEKPLSGSRGLPQLACSPGVWRLITVLIPFLDSKNTTLSFNLMFILNQDYTERPLVKVFGTF